MTSQYSKTSFLEKVSGKSLESFPESLPIWVKMIYFQGTVNDDINFEYTNGADVNVGCGAVLMGEYWYFGGEVSANRRQVVTQGFL